MPVFDSVVAGCLTPLAVLILISGLDDLTLDLAMLWAWIRRRLSRDQGASSADGCLPTIPEKRIAVFVPLWNEHKIITRMLEHNIAAIRYADYEIFVGAYPNDIPTLEAVKAAKGDGKVPGIGRDRSGERRVKNGPARHLVLLNQRQTGQRRSSYCLKGPFLT